MRKIFFALLFLTSMLCFAIADAQYTPLGSYLTTANNRIVGSLQVEKNIRLSQYAATLTAGDTVILYITRDSLLRAVPLSYVKGSGGGGSADSSIFETRYRTDTAKINLRAQIAAMSGGGADSSIFNTNYRADTAKQAIYIYLWNLSDTAQALLDSVFALRGGIETNAAGIAYNLTRINNLSDTASNLYDTAQVHEGRIATLESEVANIPIVDSTRYVLYSDSNTIYVTPTQLDDAIADIPPIDTSNIVARIDSNANSINYLDSTAYIGKPVNVQRVMIEGQSNCDGSDVDTGSLKIPPLVENQFELLDTFERVYTWDYTNNVYKKLKAGVTNYGRTGNSFGSELSFAARWEKNNPDGILVIDKKCLYGQDIPQFQKGGAQYTAILDGRPLADKWLTDRGYRVKNTAWVFIQGESDYLSAGYEYLAELNQLVSDKFSDGLIDSTTRIVISKVSTSAPLYGAGVDSAQVAFVNAAPNRKLINNDANTLGVGNHYNAAGYVQLGLSAYTQAFDADSLKTLDQFMHQPGIGTVIGEVRVENVEGDAAAAQAVVGAPAAFTVVGDNTTKYPLIVGSKTGASANSNLMWFVAGGQPIGTVFAAAAPALLIRAVSGTSLGLGANNRNADMVIQSATGNIGMGVGINPVSKLDVLGSVRARDTFFAVGNIYAAGLPKASTKDTIVGWQSGRFYAIPKPAGGSADSTTFFTKYRADTMRTNIYGAISASGLAWSDTNILGTKYDIDTVNAKIPDVSGFISWTDTVSDIGTKHDVDTLATSIYAAGYLPAATAASTYVALSGSYSNPTWITALAWSKITSTPTTLSGYGITDAVANTTTVNGLPLSSNITLTERFQAKIAGELDTLTTGVKLTFRMPANCIVDSVKGAVNVASSSGDVIFDLKKNGTTMMATNKILIEATETSSRTATQKPVLTTTTIADDDIMTLDVTSAGTNAISGEFVIYWRPN